MTTFSVGSPWTIRVKIDEIRLNWPTKTKIKDQIKTFMLMRSISNKELS